MRLSLGHLNIFYEDLKTNGIINDWPINACTPSVVQVSVRGLRLCCFQGFHTTVIVPTICDSGHRVSAGYKINLTGSMRVL